MRGPDAARLFVSMISSILFSLSLRLPEFERSITHVIFYISPYSNSIPFRRKSSLGTILFLDAFIILNVVFNSTVPLAPVRMDVFSLITFAFFSFLSLLSSGLSSTDTNNNIIVCAGS